MSHIDSKDVEITRAKMETDDVRLSLGGLLRGKRALITGVANDRSLAWAIAQAFHAEGAELAFTYPGEGMEKRVRPLAESQSVHVAEPHIAALRSRTMPYISETCLYGSSTGTISATAIIVASAAPMSVRHLKRVDSNASSAIFPTATTSRRSVPG